MPSQQQSIWLDKKKLRINRNEEIIKMNKIKMNQMRKMNQTTKRINASDAIKHHIQKRNARSSISNASNVIKPVIEDLCAESKRRIKMINQNKNHLNQTNHSSLEKSH
jgi:hypothetical protein